MDRISLHPTDAKRSKLAFQKAGENWTNVNNQLLACLSHDYTSLTPGEIVHTPEGVQRQEERESGDSDDVENHPSDHVPLASEDEDHGLDTVDDGQHDEWQSRTRAALADE